MPVNLPNFLNAQVQQEVPDVLGGFREGFKTVGDFRAMKDEALKRQLVNEMLKMENQFYPQKQQQALDMGDVNLQTGRLNLGALPQKLTDDALTRALTIGQSQRDASRDQQFGDELVQAKLDQMRAAAERARREPSSSYKPTEMERVIASIYGNDPEAVKNAYAEAGATKYGLTLPGSESLPVGSEYLKSLPKNVQAQENAYQIKMQGQVNDARKASHDLDQMQKIIQQHPDMARDFAYILGNPEDKSFLRSLTRRYIDKTKLAAIEKFTKYSNDFVLSAGAGLGQNFTDAKLKALQLSKMHAGNTDEANRAIIENYRSHLKPLINYGQSLKKARGKYTLPYFEDSYTDQALGIRPIQSLTDEEFESLSRGE